MLFAHSFPPYTPGEHAFPPATPPLEQSHPPATPFPAPPISLPPLEPVRQPLHWLWPGYLPAGKLTLVDGSPGCGTSLCALTLATHVSTGRPWPDGSPCPHGSVLFLSPHDNYHDTVLPRLQAAGANDLQVLSLSHVSDPASTDPHARRPFSLARDLAFLESLIRDAHIILLILDPYTAFAGWQRALPELIELAARTRCALVLTRSLARTPSDLLHPRCPSSPVLTAARSHLLLVPDPSDERHCLLLTPKHPLCAAPAPLAYTLTATAEDIPTLQWLPAPDPVHLRRLATGPIRSPQRQAILHYLREQNAPCPIKDILAATSYDYEPGRKMLLRMKLAGELVSPASGRYTTANHPCLSTCTSDASSPTPSIEETCSRPISPQEAQEKLFPSRIARAEAARAELRARLAAQGSYPLPTHISHVPCPDSDPPQNSTVAQSPTHLPPPTPDPTSKEPVPDVPLQTQSTSSQPIGHPLPPVL